MKQYSILFLPSIFLLFFLSSSILGAQDITNNDGGTISSTTTVATNDVSQLFDNKTTSAYPASRWVLSLAITPLPAQIQYKFAGDLARVVTGYTLNVGGHPTNPSITDRAPRNWTFEGSNNGATWTVLHTQTAQSFAASYATNTYTFANTTAYKYYRFNITANNGNAAILQLGEVELISAVAPTQVCGVVFKDFDANGLKLYEPSDEKGIESVTVSIYNDSGLVGTTTTNASGGYCIAPSGAAPYRVEFTNLPSGYSSAYNSTNNGGKTSTVFLTGFSNTANLGLYVPDTYCQTNPLVATTCFVNGQRSATGAADVLVSVNYDNSGTVSKDALKAETGSIWGLTYNNKIKKLFSSAFLKRHVDLGAAGLGGIYVTDYSTAGTPTATLIDLDPLYNLGTFTTTYASRGFVDTNGNSIWDVAELSRDVNAFPIIGKVGLGDIDITDDGNTLYTVDLNNKRVIKIDITNYAASGTLPTAADVSLLSAYPAPTCTNGTDRPFALKYYNGKLYLGVVCDASGAAGVRANLNATVFAYDVATSTWSTALPSFPLDYLRGCATGAWVVEGVGQACYFEKWQDNFANFYKYNNGTYVSEPQPWLSDIEFDTDGSMILGFMDRGGHQMGYDNYSPTAGDNTLYRYIAAGEILKAAWNGTTWIMENAGTTINGGGMGTVSSGIGGGEFYNDDYNPSHYETSLGGLAVKKGSGQVISSVYDPFVIFSGGLKWLNNQTGQAQQAVELYATTSPSSFGKANGLGDVEVLCNIPNIEIGNYVWVDADKDGVQDPSELPLTNTTVSLWKAGVQIASTTTNANGGYYFSSKYKVGATWTGTGADTTLLANTAYMMRISILQASIATPNYTTTTINSTANGGNDQNDSDAFMAGIGGTDAVIPFTTGAVGSTNHSLDFGFKPVTCEITAITAAQGLCNDNGTPSNPADDYYLAAITVNFSTKPTTGTLNLSGAATASVTVDATTHPTTHTFSAVQLPANGIVQTLTATFSDGTLCTFTNNAVPAVANCQTNPCIGNATTIGGVAFKDYNENGVKAANEGTQAGIIVHVFDCNGVEVAGSPVTTDANGNWSITGLTFSATTKYRVEFTIPPSLVGLQPAVSGTDNKTDVQFVSAASCTVNFGVNYPNDYCGINPVLATPCYINGSRALNSTESAVVLLNDNERGQGVPHQTIATIGEVGAVWGEAYNPFDKKLFVSAFIKRHVDVSPDGLGAIYAIDVTTPTTAGAGTPTLWLDINAATFTDQNNVAVTLNLPAAPSAASRDLGIKTNANRDNWGFANMGKQGIGDIELSEDGQRMYVMDLTNRQVLCIDYNTKKLIWKLPVSTPTCLGGGNADIRPWALKERKGTLYVGVICSGETGLVSANLHYYIMKCNSLTAATTMSIAVDLGNSINKEKAQNWYPWYGDISSAFIQGLENGEYFITAQPLISDIEFDKNENMIVGFMDRTGHQFGYKNLIPNVTNNNLVRAIALGDITRAVNNGTSYTVEPAPWSFFYLTAVGPWDPPTDHFIGGMVITNSDDNYLVANIVDPFTIDANGVTWNKTSDGQQQGGTAAAGRLELIPNIGDVAVFGKANGLGDLSVFCTLAPLEIGNYVWNDTDRDGVQDACETPFAGVKVALYKDVAGTLTKIAETTTNANGEYYFSSKYVLGANWTGTGVDTTLLANQAYKVVFGETQYAAGLLTVGTNAYNLTQKDATTNTGNDQNDSDAAEASIAGTNYPTIAVTTGAAGSVNHTLDVGFYGCPTITMPSGNQSICVGSAGTNITVQTNQNTASSIKFVKFTADQMVGASPTATEAAAIYAGTAIGSAVTPSGGANPFTATYTWNSADFPNTSNAAIIYYVYAITEPDGGAACRPTQEIQITISPLVSAGTATNPAAICQNGSGLTNVDLFGQLASEMTGGAWSQTAGASVGTALDTATGILNPNGIANGTYTFRYTVMGIAPCPNDTEDVMVTIQTCCPPKICLPITVTRN